MKPLINYFHVTLNEGTSLPDKVGDTVGETNPERAKSNVGRGGSQWESWSRGTSRLEEEEEGRRCCKPREGISCSPGETPLEQRPILQPEEAAAGTHLLQELQPRRDQAEAAWRAEAGAVRALRREELYGLTTTLIPIPLFLVGIEVGIEELKLGLGKGGRRCWLNACFFLFLTTKISSYVYWSLQQPNSVLPG